VINRKTILIIIFLIIAMIVVALIFSKLPKVEKNDSLESLYKNAEIVYKKGEYNQAIKIYNKIINEYPDYNKIPYIYYNLAKYYRENNKLLKSREVLQLIINEYSDRGIIQEVQSDLEDLNMQILFSPENTENSIIYEVKKGDTLKGIAKKYNTTVELIKRCNDLSKDTIIPGMELKVVNSDFSILVVKSQYMLFLKIDDKVLKTYKVSVGRGENNSTPLGEFRIVNKLVKPVWFRSGEAIPPEDSDNILGARWLGLSEKGYGIHGTTEPETIGESITQGCIRMYNPDVEELYSVVPLDTKVVIIK